MSKRRRERERELESALQDKQEADRYAEKSNSSLFFFDNAATLDAKTLVRRAKRAKKKEARQAPSDEAVSKTETKLVERAVARVIRKRESQIRKGKNDEIKNENEFQDFEATDLWCDDEEDTKSTKQKKPYVQVAMPGQSYNPSFEDHQAAVLKAVGIEEKLIEKKKSEEDWWAKRKAEQEAAILEKKEDISESEESESDNDNQKEEKTRPRVSGERITRTQRNKQKRRKIAEMEVTNAKALRLQRHELNKIKLITRQVEREERLAKARRVARDAAKADAKAIPPEPRRPPSVALSDELLESDGILRKSTSLRGPAELLQTFQDTEAVARHQPAKKRNGIIERKKPPRRKYRGAKIIARYRKPPWFLAAISSSKQSSSSS